MSDERPAEPPHAQSLEPLPESFTIPVQLIEEWFAISSHAPLTVDLRRSDLDHFYNSINRSIEAQYLFQDCMIDFTNGNVAGANVKLRNAQRRLVEAQNALRQFMAAVMVSANKGARS